MRAICFGFLFLGLLSTSAPLRAQEAEPPEAEAEIAAPEQAVSVEPVARDNQIARRIEQIMEAAGWYEDAEVEVDDGIVFLDGVARTDEQKAWARNLAVKTQDVVAVVNRIRVEPELQSSFRPALEELKSILRSAVVTFPLVLLALIILPLAWKISSWVALLGRRFLFSGVDSPFLRDILSRAVAVPVFLVGLYIVLQVAGLTTIALSLLGGAGVIGIVIGFAFRDIAENFLASLLLSIRQPFRAGDYIEVEGNEGIVQSMNTRSTVLLSSEGNHIQIPNAAVFKGVIVNYSAAPARRGVLSIGIGYDVSVASAQAIIGDVVSAHEAVKSTPAPLVLVDDLGSSTVNMKVYFWFDGQKYSVLKVRSALLRLLKKALTEAGVSMPDDAREVIFPQGVPVLQLGEEAADTARTIAETQIVETARAEAAAEESSEDATASEGDLGNEREEIEAQAAATAPVESPNDLLKEKA